MGIRRRRKKLTTMLSSIESRVRTVEMRPISLLTADQVNAAVTIGSITAGAQDGFFIGSSAPNTYHIIQDAYYYPAKLTGKADDLVEIYLQDSLSLSVDDRIEISGIHGTIAENIDVTSNNFTVAETDESPWTGRESYEHDPTQDQLPGVTIGYSYAVKPETLAPTTWSTRKRLETRATVSSFDITNTTVTVTTAADHKFQADDVIYVNFSDDSAYNQESTTAFGTDGFFTVDSVTSNTIVYTLATGYDGSTGDITPSADIYVFPTARNWCAVGDTWIDTTTDPNTTYYWTGLRWAEFTATSTGVGADSVAPDVVSNVAVVTADSGGYTNGAGDHRSKITIEWDAPTQDAEGETLNDLAGYDVWVSYVSSGDWTKSGLIGTDAAFTVLDLDPAKTIYFRIFAVDTSLNYSTGVDFNAVSGTFAGTLNPPSAPSCTSDLGVVTVKWDGLDNTSVNMHESVRYIEVHVGTSSTFTAGTGTLVTSMTAAADNYASVYRYNDGTGTLVDLAYETDYYFKLVAVDSAGNRTTGSAATIARVAQVDGAAIEAGAISAYILSGESIVATSATSTHQIELNANFLRAVNKSNSTETFRMDTADGTVTIGSGITNTTIDGNSITVSNISASSITTGTLNAANITVTNLSANSITTGTLNGQNVTIENLTANSITTGTMSGTRISGGTISGSTVSGGTLSTSGTRHVTVSNSSAYFYDSNGTLSGRVTAGEDGRAATMYFGTGVTGVFAYNGGMDLEANGSVQVTGGGGFTSVGEISSDTGMYVPANGYIDIGTARMTQNSNGQVEAYGFRATNDINCAGDFNYASPTGSGTTLQVQSNNLVVKSSSSRRYKQQIEDAGFDVDTLLGARVRQFKYNGDVERLGDDNAPLIYGYIAEEFMEIGLEDFVIKDGEGSPDSIQINSLVAALHKLIQVQSSEIESLKERLATLEGN